MCQCVLTVEAQTGGNTGLSVCVCMHVGAGSTRHLLLPLPHGRLMHQSSLTTPAPTRFSLSLSLALSLRTVDHSQETEVWQQGQSG